MPWSPAPPVSTPIAMSGDCRSIVLTTAHVLQSNPNDASVYPMRAIVARTMSGTGTYVVVVISPATQARPVVTSVSQATRAFGSSARMASRMASEMASATLSGWPSVTDSDVKRWRSYTELGFGMKDGRSISTLDSRRSTLQRELVAD